MALKTEMKAAHQKYLPLTSCKNGGHEESKNGEEGSEVKAFHPYALQRISGFAFLPNRKGRSAFVFFC